jgi:hypothetical protein
VQFEPIVTPYLEGTSFSASYKAAITGANTPIHDRISFLEDLVRGKTVLHIGFTDHLGSIEGKLKAGTWLHGRMSASASRCTGVDINAEAIAFCRDRMGLEDIYQLDVTSTEPLHVWEQTEWDYIILGEILEHVSDPALFLSGLRARYGKFAKCLVITVPNAFYVGNFTFARKRIEFINTDHRYWFTPFTLAKIGLDAGWRLDEFHFVEVPTNFGIKTWLQKRHPMLRETMIGLLRP